MAEKVCSLLIAGTGDDGRRADRVLRRVLESVPLSSVYAALRRGQVKMNGKRIKGSERIKAGDKIQIDAALLPKSSAAGAFCEAGDKDNRIDKAPLPLDILFCNEHLLALNKHKGIPTHGKCSIAEAVLQSQYGGGGEGVSLSFRPGPLHRLDRATSGVLVFSQSLIGAKWFTQQIKEHNIKKTYLALLTGVIKENAHWKDCIAPNSNTSPFDSKQFHTMIAAADDAHGKESITHVYPISSFATEGGEATFARIVIDTGRKHQIRCQCAAHGHPLFGDTSYGATHFCYYGGGKSRFASDASLFLHSARLQFPPNDIGVPHIIDAPLPKEFVKVLDAFLPDWKLYDIMGT